MMGRQATLWPTDANICGQACFEGRLTHARFRAVNLSPTTFRRLSPNTITDYAPARSFNSVKQDQFMPYARSDAGPGHTEPNSVKRPEKE